MSERRVVRLRRLFDERQTRGTLLGVIRRPMVLALLLTSVDCAELEPLEEGVCGNGVLEAGEDCDLYADASLGPNLACGACSYRCDVGSCPTGWGCSSEGVCRRPSGGFEPGPVVEGWSPRSFVPLDFNGDGNVDLAGELGARLEYWAGDTSGTFAPTFSMPTLPADGEIAAADADGDVFADVLLPSPHGFSIWRGDAKRPLQAPTGLLDLGNTTALWVIPLAYDSFGPQGVLAVLVNQGETLSRIAFDYRSWRAFDIVRTYPGHALNRLGDQVPVAEFDDGRGSFALGFPGKTVVTVYGVRRDLLNDRLLLDGFGPQPHTPHTIYIGDPAGCVGCAEARPLTVARAPLLADADGDGDPDVIVGVAGQGLPAGGVAVARWTPGLGFEPAELDPRFGALVSPQVLPDERGPWALAAGDLDGDDVADYVGADGIFFAGQPGFELAEPREGGSPWTAASIADVDGDGNDDVVAITRGEREIHVFRCGTGEWSCRSGGGFSRHSYTLERGVKKLRTGHLQDLAAADIVFVESSDDGAEHDSLGVLYANAHEWPDEPVYRARFPVIEQLEVAKAPTFGSVDSDRFDDVQISIRDGERAIYSHLYATADRQLNAPLVLPDYRGGFDISPGRAAVPGRFTTDETPNGGAILFGARTGAYPRAWWGSAATGGGYVLSESTNLALALGEDFDVDCATFASGDVDGDGLDEVVVLFGAAVCAGAAETRLAIGRVEAGRVRFDVPDVDLYGAEPGSLVAVANLDGEGGAEVVVVGLGEALVLGADAALDVVVVEAVALPAAEPAWARDLATFSPAVGTAREEIAILTAGSIVTLHDRGGVGFSTGPDFAGDHVRSADVNRDGLPDLLSAGAAGLQVFWSVPAAPLGSGQ